MRVSQQFNLGKAQSELEFVDVDVMNDTKLFIMPSALLGIHTPWAKECRTIIHDFFQELLVCITQNEEKANQLLYFLQKEPNETHLGLSRGVSQGRTLDSENSSQIRDMLLNSEAIRTQMIDDLEDTALFINGISDDKISDMTTDIIMGKLIEFTQDMCRKYNIDMQVNPNRYKLWNNEIKQIEFSAQQMPCINGHGLILVPKTIVRKSLIYNYHDFYNTVILPNFYTMEMNSQSSLVQTITYRNGTTKRKIYRKDLRAKFKGKKSDVYGYALEFRNWIKQYKESVRIPAPLADDELDEAINHH